jgi:hypothetical protein
MRRVPISDAPARIREAERERLSLSMRRGHDPQTEPLSESWRDESWADELFRRHESSEDERSAA